jgi:hypothetical protein
MISGVHHLVTDQGFLVDHESSDTVRERREIVGANRGDVGATAPIT